MVTFYLSFIVSCAGKGGSDGTTNAVVSQIQVYITTLGASAKWLAVLEDRGQKPGLKFGLSSLRSILSTGSPLAPRSFDFVYREIKSDLMLGSISGGTDMIGCCVGCCPILPVHRGEIQCRLLAMSVESWDDSGRPVWNQSGELIITRPFPSMPVCFWGDESGEKYKAAYFSKHDDVWAHGDFIELHSATMGLTIRGRSDTTLNPNGIRFGSAEIYNLVEQLPFVADSLCVAQSNRDRSDERVILMVQPKDSSCGDGPLPEQFAVAIRQAIREQLSPRFVPALMFAVSKIPYTVTGKKIELGIRRLFEGNSTQVANLEGYFSDPQVIDLYTKLAKEVGQY